MQHKKILYIDDEENNLSAFKAAMRRDFLVLSARDAKEAEQVLAEYDDVKVLIVDHGLPEITGLQFLENIKEQYPDPLRIILTGQADMQLMIDAINQVNLFRFILKPWDIADLKQSIQTAIEVYDSRRQIRSQQVELKDAYMRLNRLVYSASHEMRSPISSLQGLLELVKDEQNPENLHLYISMMRKSANTLVDFVTNLIVYYQNAELDRKDEVLNLPAICAEVLDQVRKSGNLNVAYEQQINLPAQVKGDAACIKMILGNLLSNAFKFHAPDAPNPKVNLSFFMEGSKLIVEVEDNGIGVHDSIKDKLFDMFSRGPGQISGSGIGLFVVKEITTILKGRILVTSDLQKGTKFRVELPVITE